MNNVEGSVCSSYPQRAVVPANMLDEDIEECSKFRTKERFPVMSYYNRSNGASIWRSSQPKEGIWGKVSKLDQKMVQSIISTLPENESHMKFKDEKRREAKLHIFDARSKISAIGNKVMGSGYENVDNYPSTWLWFCNIENIHKIRESYLRLLQLMHAGSLTSEQWVEHLDATGWLQHLACILRATNMIVESVRVIPTNR